MKAIYLERQGAMGFTTVLDDADEATVASAYGAKTITKEDFLSTKDLPIPMRDDPMMLIDRKEGKK